jgi:hypothetical protein
MNLQGKKHIIIRIDLETAECSMEAVGYNGQGCKEATRPFEDALGVVTDRTLKATAWNQHAVETKAQHIEVKGS